MIFCVGDQYSIDEIYVILAKQDSTKPVYDKKKSHQHNVNARFNRYFVQIRTYVRTSTINGSDSDCLMIIGTLGISNLVSLRKVVPMVFTVKDC